MLQGVQHRKDQSRILSDIETAIQPIGNIVRYAANPVWLCAQSDHYAVESSVDGDNPSAAFEFDRTEG